SRRGGRNPPATAASACRPGGSAGCTSSRFLLLRSLVASTTNGGRRFGHRHAARSGPAGRGSTATRCARSTRTRRSTRRRLGRRDRCRHRHRPLRRTGRRQVSRGDRGRAARATCPHLWTARSTSVTLAWHRDRSRRAVAIVSAVRRTLFAAVLAAVAVSVVASFPGVGSSAAKSDELVTGRKLYRKVCGRCHAVSAANAAGFGSNEANGVGALGWPSFSERRGP